MTKHFLECTKNHCKECLNENLIECCSYEEEQAITFIYENFPQFLAPLVWHYWDDYDPLEPSRAVLALESSEGLSDEQMENLLESFLNYGENPLILDHSQSSQEDLRYGSDLNFNDGDW